MGATKVSTPAPIQAPGPSEEEIAIQKQQLALLQRQVEQFDQVQPLFDASLEQQQQALDDQKALRPFILEGMGLTIDAESGGLRKMTEEEITATLSKTDLAARENLILSLERDRKALLGELPLTEAGQLAKQREFDVFKEAMARAGHEISGDDPGTATANSTAGINSLRAFNERFGLIEEAERRGQLDAASSAVLHRMGIATDIGSARTSSLLAFPGSSLSANVGPPNFGQASQQFGSLLQPYQFNRNQQFEAAAFNNQIQFNANVQSAANRTQLYGALAGAGGQVGGAAAGAVVAGLMVSKRIYKKDISRATNREEDEALEMVKDMKTYTYRYKGESKHSPKRLGLMVDNAPKAVLHESGEGLDVGRMMGVLTGATRAMARKGMGVKNNA